jgi:hypothetical protein
MTTLTYTTQTVTVHLPYIKAAILEHVHYVPLRPDLLHPCCWQWALLVSQGRQQPTGLRSVVGVCWVSWFVILEAKIHDPGVKGLLKVTLNCGICIKAACYSSTST